jgi:hypothetical protein
VTGLSIHAGRPSRRYGLLTTLNQGADHMAKAKKKTAKKAIVRTGPGKGKSIVRQDAKGRSK